MAKPVYSADYASGNEEAASMEASGKGGKEEGRREGGTLPNVQHGPSCNKQGTPQRAVSTLKDASHVAHDPSRSIRKHHNGTIETQRKQHQTAAHFLLLQTNTAKQQTESNRIKANQPHPPATRPTRPRIRAAPSFRLTRPCLRHPPSAQNPFLSLSPCLSVCLSLSVLRLIQ